MGKPAPPTPPSSTPGVPGPGLSFRPARIVVVDDDEATARLLRVMLNGEGYEVKTFADPIAALAAVKETPPDVLIADWVMPGMNGPDLMKEVRKIPTLESTYCLLITAYDLKWKKITGLLLGADDYLTKPIHETELLARIRVGVRVRRLERTAGLLSMAAMLGTEMRDPLAALVDGLVAAREHLDRGDAAAAGKSLDGVMKATGRIREVIDGVADLETLRQKTATSGNTIFDLDLPGMGAGKG